MKSYIKQMLLLLLFFLLFINGKENIEASKQALILWFESLVPSLFTCMLMIQLLDQLQAIHLLSIPFAKIIQFLFHLHPNVLRYLFTMLFLGFPANAYFMNEEVKKHSFQPSVAQHLLYACSVASPSFIILTCGGIIFQSIRIGFYLYCVQICSICFLLRRKKCNAITTTTSKPIQTQGFLNQLQSSMLKTCYTLLLIGGYLMLFMSLSAILLPYIPSDLQPFLQILQEFSSGIFQLKEYCFDRSLLFICISALLSFGGFCVHLQIFGMVSHIPLRYATYLRYRLLQAMISASIAILFTSLVSI